jgi:hypothetical protein
MANQITDNRTSVAVAKTSTPASETWAGSTSPAEDTDIFIEGDTSIAEQVTNSRRWVMYDAGSTQNWANNVFYIWINCGIVGLLDIKSNGGFTIRFAGSATTDFIEFYVGGSDSWPVTYEGGWAQFVVDIEGTPSNTGGTPPATSAIRYVGYSAITATVMTRTTDNTWIDAIWRLPDGNPGIIVEGRNGGTADWDFSDITTQLGIGAGMLFNTEGGGFACNAPIQFGINDTSTHGFTDTNKVVLWQEQEWAPDDLYQLSALGNSGGTTNVTFGVKSGTGDNATGAQGVFFTGAVTGPIWDMDFDDPNVDLVGLYGCTLQNGGDFQLDDPAVEVISSQYLDCDSATVSNSLQLRNKVIGADTADGVAFMTTDDLSDIKFCEFFFSDGHAVMLTTTLVTPQASLGNKFNSYLGTPGSNPTPSSGSTDAAIYNNAGGAVTINVSSGGDTPSVRNGASATTVVNNNISLTLSGLKDNTEVRVYTTGTQTELAGVENATVGSPDDRSVTFSLGAGTAVDIRFMNFGWIVPDRNSIINFTWPSSTTTLPITQVIDRTAVNP